MAWIGPWYGTDQISCLHLMAAVVHKKWPLFFMQEIVINLFANLHCPEMCVGDRRHNTDTFEVLEVPVS